MFGIQSILLAYTRYYFYTSYFFFNNDSQIKSAQNTKKKKRKHRKKLKKAQSFVRKPIYALKKKMTSVLELPDDMLIYVIDQTQTLHMRAVSKEILAFTKHALNFWKLACARNGIHTFIKFKYSDYRLIFWQEVYRMWQCKECKRPLVRKLCYRCCDWLYDENDPIRTPEMRGYCLSCAIFFTR